MFTCKFQPNERVRHKKTGRDYVIFGLPTQFVLEHNNAPAYAYFDESTNKMWVRSQQEMEDGRFESLSHGSGLIIPASAR